MSRDLFHPIIAPERFHPQFQALLGSQMHASARSLMNSLFARMGTLDSNFVHDFQGAGFGGSSVHCEKLYR